MKRKLLFLALVGVSLSSCTKTNELYKRDDYNSPIFNENYYEKWDGIDLLNVVKTQGQIKQLKSSSNTGVVDLKNGSLDFNPNKYVWCDYENLKHDNEFGYHNNLALDDSNKQFRYGITSKLFDGRVRCEGLYQLSRVQLNKNGFAMRFPKYLVDASYLAFACRGGTDFKEHEFGKTEIKIDVTWSFYKETTEQNLYNEISFELKNVTIPVDNNSNTALVSFMPFMGDKFDELNGAAAMSFKWQLSEEDNKVNDDYKNNEKEHHMALMLYEIFIGESSWR